MKSDLPDILRTRKDHGPEGWRIDREKFQMGVIQKSDT